jgi:hypothetical protein
MESFFISFSVMKDSFAGYSNLGGGHFLSELKIHHYMLSLLLKFP